MATDVSSAIGKLKLKSPLILGSFDPLIDEAVLRRCFQLCGDNLGAVVTKSTTLEPRSGYPEPKVSAFGEGLLVASGNTNPGIEKMTRVIRKFRSGLPHATVIGSIVNDPDHPQSSLEEEFGLLAAQYAEAGVDGVELNLSCPHLDPGEKEHTIVPAQDGELVARLVSTVRRILNDGGFEACAVIAKLTGWQCNPAEVARSAERAGADAVTISNLFPGTGYYTGLGAESARTSRSNRLGAYLVAHGKGAYSGKAMHSPVLLMIENVRKHVGIPILGAGGCATDLDSLVQTFMAGAAAVQAVTPFYFSDLAGMDVLLQVNHLLARLREFLEANGLSCPQDLYHLASKTRHG